MEQSKIVRRHKLPQSFQLQSKSATSRLNWISKNGANRHQESHWNPKPTVELSPKSELQQYPETIKPQTKNARQKSVTSLFLLKSARQLLLKTTPKPKKSSEP